MLIIAAIVAILGIVAYYFIAKKSGSEGDKEIETSKDNGTIPPIIVSPPTPQQQTETLSPVSGTGKALVDSMVAQVMQNSVELDAALFGIDKNRLFDGLPDKMKEKMQGREYALPLNPTQKKVAERGANIVRISGDLWGQVSGLLSLNTDFTGGALFPDFQGGSEDFADEVLCKYVSGGCKGNNKKRNDQVKSMPLDTVTAGVKKFFQNYIALSKAAENEVLNYSIRKLKNAGYNFPVTA